MSAAVVWFILSVSFCGVYGFCVISNLDMLALATASATTKADLQRIPARISDIIAMKARRLIVRPHMRPKSPCIRPQYQD